MSDVTAVVVHQNEPYLGRALESIERQTLRAAEIVIADPEAEPVHRALNEAVAQVRTPYFVQVDADMILDDDCFELLRRDFPKAGGLAVGRLRDPLAGRIEAIKLFSSALFDAGGLPDSVSPDADFQKEISRKGYLEVHVVKFGGSDPEMWHTIGDHDPGYTEARAFGRFFNQGSRYAYRRNPQGLQSLFRRLQKRDHPAAMAAQAGAAIGLFTRQSVGVRVRVEGHADFDRLDAVLQRPRSIRPITVPSVVVDDSLTSTFVSFYRCGARLAADGCRQDLRSSYLRLSGFRDWAHWFALVALFRGVIDARADEQRALEDAGWLADEVGRQIAERESPGQHSVKNRL